MIELLAPALAACLLLACILSYFGLHVLLREVIFVDLALAQLAALGAAVGHLLSGHTGSLATYLTSLGFTLAGAAIFFAAIAQRFLAGWLIGTAACSAGIAASAYWDLPTGAAVVTALGVAFALAALGSIFWGAADR